MERDIEAQIYDSLTKKDLGYVMLLIGKPGSGKTTLIKKMLTSKTVYNYVFLVSPSAVEYPEIPESQKTLQFTSGFVIKAINMVNSAIGKENKARVLFILDDCIAELKEEQKNPKIIGLFFNRRHLLWNGCVDLLVTTQKYTMLPAKFRSCLTDLLIFGVSPFDIKKIMEESTMLYTKKVWMEYISKLYDTPHNFVYVDIDRQLFVTRN